MTAPTVIPTETGGEQHLSILAQDAAEALIALGWPVIPHGPDMDRWQIGDLIWTDDELMGLAARHGVRPASDRVQ
ncbi:hypothetical protein ACFQE0_13635 [Methylobacterium komagatae]|uniref:Uncharacterized protein n=1 Tax=Methylobacterium komagatae TaxID=374425 RepID=A0ABW2BK20_9HYPH